MGQFWPPGRARPSDLVEEPNWPMGFFRVCFDRGMKPPNQGGRRPPPDPWQRPKPALRPFYEVRITWK